MMVNDDDNDEHPGDAFVSQRVQIVSIVLYHSSILLGMIGGTVGCIFATASILR